MIPDQFQFLDIEGMNYSVCLSAKSDYVAETKELAEPGVRFYTKLVERALSTFPQRSSQQQALIDPRKVLG